MAGIRPPRGRPRGRRERRAGQRSLLQKPEAAVLHPLHRCVSIISHGILHGSCHEILKKLLAGLKTHTQLGAIGERYSTNIPLRLTSEYPPEYPCPPATLEKMSNIGHSKLGWTLACPLSLWQPAAPQQPLSQG